MAYPQQQGTPAPPATPPIEVDGQTLNYDEMTPGMQDLAKLLNKSNQPQENTNASEGVVQRVFGALFGRHLREMKVKQDHRFMGGLGKILAPLLLVLFSVATILVIEKNEIARIPWITDNIPIIMVVTTILFVVTMDVCMLLAILWIRDMFASKRPWTEQRVALVVTLIGFVLVITAIEALTFYAMLTGAEITGLLNICRAIWIPNCAVFLMARPKRVLSREDIDQHILAKVASAMINSLEQLSISGQAAFGDLLEIFLHLTLPDNPTEAAKQKARDVSLVALLNRMKPNAWVQDAAKYINEQRALMQQENDRLKQEIEALRSKIECRSTGYGRDDAAGAFATALAKPLAQMQELMALIGAQVGWPDWMAQAMARSLGR